MEENKYSYLNELLNGVKVINDNYPQSDTNKEFNLFKVIRKGHEEVTLHSKFIFELLDPFGSHGMNNYFLNLFIDKVNSSNPDFHFNSQGARAHYEKQNIDLLIQNHSQAIIIENKIFAGDQPNQIYRYCDNIYGNGTRDILIIYLTLNGKKPSDQSISCPNDDTDLFCEPEKINSIIKKRLKNYAYETFIIEWLDTCLETITDKFTLTNIVEQYKKLLIDLTQSKEIEERKDLVEYLGKNDLMQQAHYLVENWNHVKWHVEMDFWDELKNTLPEQLKNMDFNKDYSYSVEKIDKAVHSSRSRNLDYGLALNLFKVIEGKVFFMVHRGPDSLSYVIRILNEKKSNNMDLKINDFKEYLSKSYPKFKLGGGTSDWVQWKYIVPDINFEAFNNHHTLLLADPVKRKSIIQNLWQEFSDYIATVMKWDGIPVTEKSDT